MDKQISSIICLIIGLLLLAGAAAYLVYSLRKFVKAKSQNEISKKQLWLWIIASIGAGLSISLLLGSLFLANPSWGEQSAWLTGPYKDKAINYASSLSLSLIGGFIFGASNAVLWSAFSLRFYKTNLLDKALSGVKLALYASIPFVIFAALIWLEGIAPYLSYPLFNGFSIDGSGFHFTKPNGFDGASTGGLHIAFYALVILFGVAIAYWVSDHRFYQKYHKHGILDTLVLVAFPAGVIGARVWYVVGNWDREFAGKSWTKPFEIWEGGLTILGGAAAGVLVGYLFLRATKKFVDMRFAIDAIVPTVLLAQAMGRLGNFFNLEVYGQVASVSNGWDWLPSWLVTNMSFNNGGGQLTGDSINIPLFFVEAVMNVIGYFLIAYGVGKLLKKWTSPGDLCGCYFLWYGLVRIVMEPMRNANFNMGTDNAWSICNSIAYILIGVGLIAAFHLSDRYKKTKKSLHFPIIGMLLCFPGFFFPFLSSINVSSSKDGSGTTSVYNGFEIIFGKSAFYLIAYILLILTFVAFAIWVMLKIMHINMDRVAGITSALLSLLTGIFFFVGKSTCNLGDIGDSYVNLSYGFVLIALFAILAAILALVPTISSWFEKKNAQRANAVIEANENNEESHA